jgi:hypothetical protein
VGSPGRRRSSIYGLDRGSESRARRVAGYGQLTAWMRVRMNNDGR